DYTVAYADNINVGTASATVTITGTGNYSGDAFTTTTFLIRPKDINEAFVAPISNQLYTGATLTPALTITDGVNTLVKDTDYTLSYSNNVNVGQATVTITGINNYTATQQATFTIQQKAITAAELTIAPVSAETYTGAAITPPLVVTEGANTLKPGPGQDYTVTYADNINVGTASATVTITGTGNYSGNASTATTFLIMPKDINEAKIAVIPDQTYTGAAITPVLTVTDGIKTLVKDVDYTVGYNDNELIGTATVTITGINNYTATQQTSFNIIRKSLDGAGITVEPISYQTYTGAAIEPPVVVTYGTSTLEKGTDYTVDYTNNVNVGTAKVTITGAGNYSGTIDEPFDIVKATQTIDFPGIPDLLLINGPYVLRATATSGLPVTYTSSNTVTADIGSDGVTLLLKDFGAVTITATQQGNDNYYSAPSEQRQVNVVESGNTVANVTVIGAKFDAVNSRYVMNCSENSVTVIVAPEDYTARVYYNNALGNIFNVEVPTGVRSITYTVQSGANEQAYPLEIAKPFKFDDVVKMRWDNTLTVINNPANNGGFHFTSFAWYGDGRLITTDQSFSAGNTGQSIDPTISYHVVLEAEEYTGALNTCPSLVELRHSAADMVAYPNPAQSNGFIFVEINMGEEQLDHAEIEIFNIVGLSMGKVRVAGQITPLNMSSLPTGMYLLNLRGKNNLNKIVKVVVQ
ncbi:MAG: T9SS type A sorting domain-containing protein, partial [Prevotellaceae bacterium]|nr:T9SS type A sorting domain-containing protein [Prevotellaceae bacterium]